MPKLMTMLTLLLTLCFESCIAMTFRQCERYGEGTRVKYFDDEKLRWSRLCSIFYVKRFAKGESDENLYGEVVLNPADNQPYDSVTIQWLWGDENKSQIQFVRSGYRQENTQILKKDDKLRAIPKAKREPDTYPRKTWRSSPSPLPKPVCAIVTHVFKTLVKEEGPARWEYVYVVKTVEETYTDNESNGVIEVGLVLKERFNLWEKVTNFSGSSSGAKNSPDNINGSSDASDKQEEQTYENFKRQVLDDPASGKLKLDTFYRKNGNEWEEIEIKRYDSLFDDFDISYQGGVTEKYNKDTKMTWTLKNPQQQGGRRRRLHASSPIGRLMESINRAKLQRCESPL